MPRLFLLLLLPTICRADPLPRVVEADWPQVRLRGVALLAALKKHPGALPADIEKQLSSLLTGEPKDIDAALAKLQQLLDPLCLAGVHINPESRVKAARGPAVAELTRGKSRVVLLKVNNEAGITAPLNVTGDGLGRGGWLESSPLNVPELRKLSGSRVEYVPWLLTARESGRREATLKFDAGQGTQDLGFRAEVPILFRIVKP